MFDSLNTTQSDEEMAQVCNNAEDDVKEAKTEALVKDLKTLMAAATKTYSKSRRNSRTDSFSKAFTDESNDTSGKRNRLSSGAKKDDEVPKKKERKSSRASNKLRNSITISRPETQTEASQMVEVSWDDPVARQHQKMLAHDLAKNSESFSPDKEFRGAPLEHPNSSIEEDRMHDADVTMDEIVCMKTKPQSPVREEKIRTPEAPSIAFPLPRRSSTITPPKPLDLTHDSEEETEMGQEYQQSRLFLLSGMGHDERNDYGALVEELGGLVSDAAHYDTNCTHLVVGNPARNEKYLAAVAAGKWVLHKSYFEACRQDNQFVQEEPHEWGSEYTTSILQAATPQVVKLAQAAHRWRIHLHKHRSKNTKDGAFGGWKVLLLTEKKREDGFRRLLEAGGGHVVATKPPFSKLDTITHAFMDLNKIKIQVDFEQLLNVGIHCLKPEYIAAFLMDEPQPQLQEYYIQQVLPLLQSTEDHRKRKASGADTPSGKRYKR